MFVNYSKKNICFRCKAKRTPNCEIVRVPIKKPALTAEAKNSYLDAAPPSHCLIIKGSTINQTNEVEVR